ncbi:MAG: hypothetical protein HY703_11390, partial [Gemmatimonadetes bacterium]|nr:hypothetical protein [Gemmatimonadota bacterium]
MMESTRRDEWRLIETGPLCGAENMALDQALLESVQAGGRPVLRFYRWSPPCLSLGRNQPWGPWAAPPPAEYGVAVVRRPTGGGAVYHDRELTYAVAIPIGMLGGPRATYFAIHGGLGAGLRQLGVPVETALPSPRPRGGKGGRVEG